MKTFIKMKPEIKKINDALFRLDDVVEEYRKARSEGWKAVAEFLSNGPVKAVLSEKHQDRIRRELETIPEGLEREAMAAAGGPGYLEGLAEESVEMEYRTGNGPKTGLIESVRMDDGLKVTVVDQYTGKRTEVGIDDMVDAVAPVMMFILHFAK
jgi:hypothetical protein